MTEDEVRTIVEKVLEVQDAARCTSFSNEEVESIKSLLHTKKNAAKVFVLLLGMIGAWIVKDIYVWIATHLKWIGG